MHKNRLITAVIILSIFTLVFYTLKINYTSRGFINKLINKEEGKTLDPQFKIKIKSGNLCTDYNIEQALKDIDKFGLNTLNVPVVINIPDVYSASMTIDKESEKRALALIQKLKGKKINIILEPYPWIDNGNKAETDWDPDNINEFFYNWTHKVLKPLIDDVAVPYHVDAFNIGTSFVHMESYEKNMCSMVDYVRKYYKGLVTYRTNFWCTAEWAPDLNAEYKSKLNNKVFSKLDFISIASYFELTDNATNTADNLTAALQSTQRYKRKQNVKKEIKNFYDKWKKPVFFGELGFPKTDMASVAPWNPNVSSIMNNQEQANCFEAYRRVFEDEPWNLGFSIFAIGKDSSDIRYYPSNESAAIIKQWYRK